LFFFTTETVLEWAGTTTPCPTYESLQQEKNKQQQQQKQKGLEATHDVSYRTFKIPYANKLVFGNLPPLQAGVSNAVITGLASSGFPAPF
jgi:hypothetical protein